MNGMTVMGSDESYHDKCSFDIEWYMYVSHSFQMANGINYRIEILFKRVSLYTCNCINLI